jgi:hypothetical protein
MPRAHENLGHCQSVVVPFSWKCVSHAQSGRGGRKGCDPLLSFMPVDSATAYVAIGIAGEADVRNGEQRAASDRTAEIVSAQEVLEARIRARQDRREDV